MFDQIVERFKQDCLDDKLLLSDAMQKGEVQNSRLIVHRLAGRLGQIGAKDLAKDLRLMELAIAADGLTNTNEQKKTITDVLARLDQLLTSIDEKIM